MTAGDGAARNGRRSARFIPGRRIPAHCFCNDVLAFVSARASIEGATGGKTMRALNIDELKFVSGGRGGGGHGGDRGQGTSSSASNSQGTSTSNKNRHRP